jgi:hypothetical protein
VRKGTSSFSNAAFCCRGSEPAIAAVRFSSPVMRGVTQRVLGLVGLACCRLSECARVQRARDAEGSSMLSKNTSVRLRPRPIKFCDCSVMCTALQFARHCAGKLQHFLAVRVESCSER